MGRVIVCLLISLCFSNICFCKIAPKNGEDKIVIKEGDTLWSLAKKYYNDPSLWPKFNEYNIIDKPGLIYPGEKLAIGKDLALSLANAMRGRMKRLEKEKGGLKGKIEDLKREIEILKANYEEQIEDLRKQLPTDEEMRLRHQAEIEVMENEILLLQDEINKSREEKGSLSLSLELRFKEIKEKKREIEGKEDEIRLLEEKLSLRDEEIAMLNTGIFELEEKLEKAEEEIKEKNKRIEELKNEKGLYTDLSHFLIFALLSGIFALGVIN
ncbi:MAG: LysM peptidoglycan-binding domain-containing protein [bacterium]